MQFSALRSSRQGSCFQYYSVNMASISGEMAENPHVQCRSTWPRACNIVVCVIRPLHAQLTQLCRFLTRFLACVGDAEILLAPRLYVVN